MADAAQDEVEERRETGQTVHKFRLRRTRSVNKGPDAPVTQGSFFRFFLDEKCDAN